MANASDSFTGANGTSLDGRTLSDGVHTWTARVGAWAIQSNQADPDATANAVLTCDPGCADADVAVTVPASIDANEQGVVLRWADSSNYLFAVLTTTAVRLRKREGGVASTVASAVVSGANGDTIRAHAVGDQVSVFHTPSGGAESEVIAAQTVTLNQTATVHGIYSTGTTAHKLDDFAVTDLGAAGGNRRRRLLMSAA